MDFAPTAEQRALRDEIVKFAQRELNQDLVERDRNQLFPRELWSKCGEIGLTGLPVPEELGGAGLDSVSTALALEAFGYGCEDSGLVFSISAHLLSCVVPLWKHGNGEQQRKYLPGLCDGTLIGVHAMTEPNSGSDAFALATTAVPERGGWKINGTKIFISNGPVADVVVVFAMTDRAAAFHGGVSAFIVEKDAPGFRTSKKIEKMGLRTSPFGELSFEDCWVPDAAVLGHIGGGGPMFTSTMDWERVCLFAAHVGTMERLLEQAVRQARTRTQFGQQIGKFQAISHRIADMKIRLEAARLLIYKAAWQLERSKTSGLDAAIAKVFVSESLVQAALDTVQVFGGYGFCTEYEVERQLRDAIGSTLYSGTSEIQRTIISRWLGLKSDG
jgi:alkylation response protein AidB-like acyl-CoA dehydrogenase